MLSSVEPLITNLELQSRSSSSKEKSNADKPLQEKRIFIKLPDISDSRINTIYRMAALNRGSVPIVLYDSKTKKYSAMKGIGIEPSEKVLTRLSSVFSPENVIYR